MKQPELGRKIAELRKSKGFTQEQLVEKCNLNVRTLQRIESGEVLPRTYTLHLIFSALDFDMSQLESEWTDQQESQEAADQTGLFQLKTETMKKISILSAALLVILLVVVMINSVFSNYNNQALKSILEDRNKNIVAWFNAGKVDAIMDYYAQDACFYRFMQIPYEGKIAVKRCFELAVENHLFTLINIEIISLHQEGTLAVEKSRVTSRLADGKIVKTIYMKEWQYENEKWLTVNDMDVYVVEDE